MTEGITAAEFMRQIEAAKRAAQPRRDSRPVRLLSDIDGNWIEHRAGDVDDYLPPFELKDRP